MTCPGAMSARALIFAADRAMSVGVRSVAAASESINMLWTWLEKSNIKIFATFHVDDSDFDVSKISANLHSVFKKGAGGVQLIAAPETLNKLATALAPIAPDLFFGRELILVTDLNNTAPGDWETLFHSLKRINAAGLGILIEKKETTAGAIYGMLDAFDSDFGGYLQVISKDSDMQTIENAWRLLQKMRPEVADRTVFFLPDRH